MSCSVSARRRQPCLTRHDAVASTAVRNTTADRTSALPCQTVAAATIQRLAFWEAAIDIGVRAVPSCSTAQSQRPPQRVHGCGPARGFTPHSVHGHSAKCQASRAHGRSGRRQGGDMHGSAFKEGWRQCRRESRSSQAASQRRRLCCRTGESACAVRKLGGHPRSSPICTYAQISKAPYHHGGAA